MTHWHNGATHCQRVLDLLSDGQPHTHHELYQLGVIAHSRVADLRRKGHNIVCWTANDHGERVSVYQLLPALPEADGPGSSPGASLSASGSAIKGRVPPTVPAENGDAPGEQERSVHPGQLSIGEAA